MPSAAVLGYKNTKRSRRPPGGVVAEACDKAFGRYLRTLRERRGSSDTDVLSEFQRTRNRPAHPG